MRLDEALGRNYPFSVPTIRFFTWQGHSISLGRNQIPEKRLTLELCSRDGITVVRRPTGGKELLHGHDLCYSVLWPVEKSGIAVEAGWFFGRINDILTAALKRLNIRALWKKDIGRSGAVKGPCFLQTDRGEITVDGRKLIASAQRVFEKVLLQQGSMPLRESSINLADYLKEFNRVPMKSLLESSSTSFFEHVDETISLNSIVDVFKKEFQRSFGVGSMPIEDYFVKRINVFSKQK
ncbi:MAG: hypothetical protein V3W18_02265 [candidate division Zixibacteria bacterium]